MTDRHWIPIFMQQQEAVMTFWTIYVLVAALLLGFAAQKAPLDTPTRWLLAIAFFVFAIANYVPMYDALVTHERIYCYLSTESRAIFNEPSAQIAAIVHIVLDVMLFLYLFWFSRAAGQAPKEDRCLAGQ